MFVDVIINRSHRNIDELYTYEVGEDLIPHLEPGMRVLLPFGRGNKQEVALVIALKDEVSADIRPKRISSIIDSEPLLTQSSINLALFMKHRYLTTYKQAFDPFIPKTIFGSLEEVFVLVGQGDDELQNIFQGRGEIKRTELTSEERSYLKPYIERGKVTRDYLWENPIQERKISLYRIVKSNPEKINEKQGRVLELLRERPREKREIKSVLGISDSPIDTLERRGIIERYIPAGDFRERVPLHTLNESQKRAYEEILTSQKVVHLLHGVTGSGKTEVYLYLAGEMMRRDQSVILLLPEISLTPQMIYRFERHFGDVLSVIHSNMSQGERVSQWMRSKTGKSKIIIGARSALFAPVNNLGLIILDEEQEDSYNYHDSLRYDTKEVAEKRALLTNAKVLYGSATPSVELYYRAKEGKVALHKLPHRANIQAKPPKVRIVDMREELTRGNTSIFSEEMAHLIDHVLQDQKQAILFMNRRGFSHFVSCRVCGHVIRCDHCDISMTYHQSIHRLRCHYCGMTKPMVQKCPVCGSKYIKQFGAGTQRVEEETRLLFPKARIFRMDRDTMGKKNAYEQLFHQMKNREIDILIGTQMLAKGMDFPHVTFVGMVAADTNLYISDFRAQERTYQLLTQVGGRAGRGIYPGSAIVQTYNPDNYAILHAKQEDYEKFYEKEMAYRKSHSYPPFVKLFGLSVNGIDRELTYHEATKWVKTFEQIQMKEEIPLEIVGITEQPKVRERYEFQIMIKVSLSAYELLLSTMEWVLSEYYRKHKNREGIYLTIHID